MDNFQLAKYEFVTQAREELRVPAYMGSTLRGGFGHVFKRVVCLEFQKDCSGCILKYNCAYSYIFETPLPKDTEVLSRIQNIPRPFVLEPPLEGKTHYQPLDELRFGLVLIGKAMDFLPYFVFTFEELGRRGLGKKRGRLNLLAIYSLRGEERKQIYFGESKSINDDALIVRFNDLAKLETSVQRIHIEFLTPTRIQQKNIILRKIDFHSFIQNLLGRISMLSYFHCGTKLELDFKGILERARTVKVENSQLGWNSWNRYSSRQKRYMKWDGVLGGLDFVGQLNEFLPYILLGEYVHIGKGTAFGLGRIAVKL